MENNIEHKFIKEFFKNNVIEIKEKKIFVTFFRTLYLLIFVFVLLFIINVNMQNKFVDHVAIIDVDSIIDGKTNISAKNIINDLNDAFFNKHSKAIIIRINSSGGSPVQSHIIYNHIKRLRKISDKPIYSVIEDIGTSGAYLISTAAEKIYCNPTSIIGSIGVIMSSFGYVEAMNKLGVERRIYKSGKNKVLLDPFLSINKEDEQLINHNINIVNQYFINTVKKNRENKLNYTHDIFSGKFWTGKDALELGFVDGFYDIYTLCYDVIKVTNIVDYNSNSSRNFSFLNFIK